MGKNNNIIEINGKAYDAKTGEVLSDSKNTAASSKMKKNKPIHAHVTNPPSVNKPTMNAVVRKSGKQIYHHPAKTSKTLMRSTVQKPSDPLKRHVKAQGPSEVLVKIPSSLKKKTGTKLHSVKSPKNPLIQHFAPIEPTSIQPVLITPVIDIEPTTEPKNTIKSKPKTTADLLENAIKNATSHEQTPLKKPKNRKKKNTAILAVLGVMLLGFVAYQEAPTAKLELASARAGFNAALPSYKPAGFSLGELNYSSGVVATTFKSNSDQRSYTLTQKTTDWDSQALKDNFVKEKSKAFETMNDGGQTIYIYGDNNATWVSGGVWYILQADGVLTQNQIVELAKSL